MISNIWKKENYQKPLAVVKVKQEEFQIILSKKEDKEIYSKSLTVIPWITQRFEYILSSNKIVIKKDIIISYLLKNWGVKAILEPIFIEDIFTGTFKLITDKKLEESKRKFELENIIYFINSIIKKKKTTQKKLEKDNKDAKDSKDIISTSPTTNGTAVISNTVNTVTKATVSSTTTKDNDRKAPETLKKSVTPNCSPIDCFESMKSYIEPTGRIKFKNPLAITVEVDEVAYEDTVELITDVFKVNLVLKIATVGTVIKVLQQTNPGDVSTVTMITDDNVFIQEMIKLKQKQVKNEKYIWKFTFTKQTSFNVNDKGKYLKIIENPYKR